MPDPIPGQNPDREESSVKGFDPKAAFVDRMGEQAPSPRERMYSDVRNLLLWLLKKKSESEHRDILEGENSVFFYPEVGDADPTPIVLPSLGLYDAAHDAIHLSSATLDQYTPHKLKFISNPKEDSSFIRVTFWLFKDGKPYRVPHDLGSPLGYSDDAESLYTLLLAPEMDPKIVQERDWPDNNAATYAEKLLKYPVHLPDDTDCEKILDLLKSADIGQ